jgi:hypothetical protein
MFFADVPWETPRFVVARGQKLPRQSLLTRLSRLLWLRAASSFAHRELTQTGEVEQWSDNDNTFTAPDSLDR